MFQFGQNMLEVLHVMQGIGKANSIERLIRKNGGTENFPSTILVVKV